MPPANLSKTIQKFATACYLLQSEIDLQVSGKKGGKWKVTALHSIHYYSLKMYKISLVLCLVC